MDFELDDEQQAISDLAAQILGDRFTHERLTELEQTDPGGLPDEWAELARADLLGIGLPERVGGNGFGILAACLVLEQIGRRAAPLPYLATVVLGAMPVAEFGTDEQQQRLLPGVIDGSILLSAALLEDGDALPPAAPVTRADRTDGGWTITGSKVFVPDAGGAHRVLVPAGTPEGVGVFLVDPQGPGVEVTALEVTDGSGRFHVDFEGAFVDDVDVVDDGARGAAIVDWVTDRTVAGLCALQAGVCASALEMTATYTTERQQFNVPIATFQAVAQRAADAFIDATGVEFTARHAAWRLDAGLPAADALDVAKYWAAEGGQRVVHAAQHLHGGIGVDKDYPLHRYFLWAKVLELSLGGASQHLRRLGARLAADPA